MPLSAKDMELMDKAIRQELTDAEQVQFEQRMQNTGFQNEYELLTKTHAASRKHGQELLKADLRKIEKSIDSGGRRVHFLKPTVMWPVAAAVMLLVLAALYLLLQQDSPTELYATYFEAPPNLVAPIQKGENLDSDAYRAAFRSYEQGEYALAERQFAQLDNGDPNVLFYRAITAMELNNMDQAIFMLRALTTKSETTHGDHADWYLALAHLAQGDVGRVKELLAKIAGDTDHPYRKEARELSAEL